jgi:amino acid adenylation domain-containing protein
MDFWERELKGFVGLGDIQFPTLSCTRSLEPPASPTCIRTSLTLQASWEQLDNLAQQLGLKSGVSVVRGAFAYTLAEYTETDKIILGDQDLANLAQDSSINLIPISILPQDNSEDFLCRLDKFQRTAAAIPSPNVQDLRDVLRIPSSQAPYNAVFAYRQLAAHESDPGCSRDASRTSLEAPIELNLQTSDKGQPICSLSSQSLLMDSSHLELLMKQIDSLVTTMCSAPAEHIHDLTQLFPKELISIHSPVVSDDVKMAPLISPAHWVDHWASSNPSWIGLEIIDAISEDDTVSRKWTYRDLSETSSRLCGWLVSRGWRNRSIAVCLDRSFMAYCLVLAIWKSGNCYVPIAEDLPEARQLFLLSDSGATAFFVDEKVSKILLSTESCEVIDIASLEICANSESIEDKQSIDPKPSDDCYLLYTSGSTGAPKGVLVSRGNLSAFTEAQSDYICRDVPDTPKLKGVGSYLAHASRAFDVHICEMVLGWRHGFRLVTGQRSMLLDNLFLVLRRFEITHAGFVPSLLEHAGVSAESLPDLRYLGVGGEKISETIIERFVGKQSISLVNAYGPTEATIGFTSHTVKPWSTVRNIGTAVGNITVHVLESNSSKYVKRGQAGELCVTGDLVASGYHRRPDAAGFADHHGQRMYRTGDIVRLMANDCIEYLGRRDSQAKIRGQRLELEEVSIAIRRCAGFPVNVTSMVTPSPITKRPQLVSFISPSGNRLDPASTEVTFLKSQYQEWVPKILESCRTELPAYMVPSVLLPVSFIPIQISGKADTRRLVALYETIPISDLLLGPGVMDTEPISEPDLASNQETNSDPHFESDGADMTAGEMQVRDIICSQIDADPGSVTRATSIFQLGIDSLGALGVAGKMRQAGYACSAVDILSKATVAKLALLPNSSKFPSPEQRKSFSEEQEAGVSHRLAQLDRNFRNSQAHIPNSSISVIRPCLPLQESIVSSSVGSPKPLYVNHIMCRLGNSVKLTNLKSAFEDLMHQNEILRTCFPIVDNKVLQVVLKPRMVTIPWNEVVVSDENVARGLFNTRQAGIASKIIQKIDKEPPFHILAASPICEEDPGWFMLSIHHSIFDGASMGIFLKQLHHHYTGNAAMCPVDLAPLYNYMEVNAEEDTESFWSPYLDGYLPGIVEDDDSDGGSYSIMTKTLPFGLSSLSKIASEVSSTTPIILETVWAIVLAECLDQRDVIFGRVMNGRSIPVNSVEEMLVPLVTTVPARFRLPSIRSSLLELAKVYTQAMFESLPHQHTPLRAIQRYTRVPGPLFNTLISYIVTSPQSPWKNMLTEMDSVMPADYPLALEINAEPGVDQITLRLRISKALSSNERYASLVERTSALLTELVSNGDAIIEAAEPSMTQKPTKLAWDESQWTDVERKIRQVVAVVSGISESQVSKNASFFALGIDSVISIHLARCLKKENIDASPSDILRHPSIGALHNHLGRPRAVSLQVEALEISLDHDVGAELFHSDDLIVETYPCTPLQTAMIGQCLSTAGKGYLHHHVVTLSGSLDLERLFDAWQETVKNTDILRTSFHRQSTNNQFHAAVHKYPLVQWSHQSNIASLPQAIETVSQDAFYPSIESFNKPPWKVTLLTGNSQQLMVLTMHHCLYDGFSLPLLFTALENSYLGHTESPGSFAPVARRIASKQSSSIKFWTDVIADYQYFGLPISQPSTQLEVQWAEIKIPTGVPELQRRCGAVNVTLQTVALLAFGRSLMPIVGQRDVVFGHVVSGRSFDIEDSMNVIGPLFNTVPFRLKLESAQKSTIAVLQDIQNFSIDCQPFQNAPLSLVQKSWRMANNGNGSSLFDALFTFNKSDKFSAQSIFQPFESSRQPDIPHYRLNVEFDQSANHLVIRAVTRDLLTKKSDLETWTQTLALGVEEILSSCNEPALKYPPGIDDLPMVKGPLSMADDASPDNSVFRTYMDGLKLILSQVTHTEPEKLHESNSVFALGLDSILALDVSSQCRNAGLEISVAEILQGETIRGIAKLASDKPSVSSKPTESTPVKEFSVTSHARSKALSILSLSDDKIEDVIPCLSGQSFYIASWLRSQRKLWEFTFPLTSSSKLDPEKLQHAWQQLQRRHSILRTAFAAIHPDQVVQVVRKPCQDMSENKIHIEQASGDLKLLIQDLIQSIGRKKSDLFTPPIRLGLVQHAESDVILLTLHHALYDARAISILVHDLEALYQGKALSPPSNFTSFVLDTQQKYESGFADDYWKEALVMGQRTILGAQCPDDLTPLCVQSSQAIFPRDLTILKSQCHEKNISIPSLMILAIARSLARTAEVSHPTFGLFQNGRSNDYPEIDQMAGPTVNMLPLVVPDASVSPSRETLVSMQQKLAQRALYDQTDLQSLFRKIKTVGQEIEFNLLVNILWSQSSSAFSKEVDSIFAPLSLDSEIRLDSDDLITEETAVDHFDWKCFPGGSSIYLEVGYNEEHDSLLWKLDYTSVSMSKQRAEEFLQRLEDEMKTILVHL